MYLDNETKPNKNNNKLKHFGHQYMYDCGVFYGVDLEKNLFRD